MAVLARIAMIVLAYILACIAASLILTIGTLTPEWDDLTALGLHRSPFGRSSWSAPPRSVGLRMMPALLVIALTEGLPWRSSLIYAALGGVLALSLSFGLDFAGLPAIPKTRWCASARCLPPLALPAVLSIGCSPAAKRARGSDSYFKTLSGQRR